MDCLAGTCANRHQVKRYVSIGMLIVGALIVLITIFAMAYWAPKRREVNKFEEVTCNLWNDPIIIESSTCQGGYGEPQWIPIWNVELQYENKQYTNLTGMLGPYSFYYRLGDAKSAADSIKIPSTGVICYFNPDLYSKYPKFNLSSCPHYDVVMIDTEQWVSEYNSVTSGLGVTIFFFLISLGVAISGVVGLICFPNLAYTQIVE